MVRGLFRMVRVGLPGVGYGRRICLPVFSLLSLVAITVASCSTVTPGTSSGATNDTKFATVQSLLDPNSLAGGHNWFTKAVGGNAHDRVSIEKVDEAKVRTLGEGAKVRVSPGLHSFVVTTSHVVREEGRDMPGKPKTPLDSDLFVTNEDPFAQTEYCIQRWLVTFPIVGESTYHIARGYQVGDPPSVYRIGDPSIVGKMPNMVRAIDSGPAEKEGRLREWYSKQERIMPETRPFCFEKDRRPSEWYLREGE